MNRSKVFIFDDKDDHALWVSGLKTVKGIIRGWVINGQWSVRINPRLKTLGVVGDRTSHPYTSMISIDIPENMKSENSNRVIDWAIRRVNRRYCKTCLMFEPYQTVYLNSWWEIVKHFWHVHCRSRRKSCLVDQSLGEATGNGGSHEPRYERLR